MRCTANPRTVASSLTLSSGAPKEARPISCNDAYKALEHPPNHSLEDTTSKKNLHRRRKKLLPAVCMDPYYVCR